MTTIKLTAVEAGLLRELIKGTIPELQAMAEHTSSIGGVSYGKSKGFYEAKISGLTSILKKIEP